MAFQQFNESLDSAVELFLDEASYEFQATPLKPARYFKQEHIRQIKEFFKLNELTEQIEKSEVLLMDYLPGRTTDLEFKRIKSEIDSSGANCAKYLDSLEGEAGEKSILLQEMSGFTDDTLITIYSLASDFMHKGDYSNAFTLLVLLTSLAPHVQSYWIAEAICLQQLNRFESALTVLEGAMLLDGTNPAVYAYSAECYQAINQEGKVKEALSQLKTALETYIGPDKEIFAERISV